MKVSDETSEKLIVDDENAANSHLLLPEKLSLVGDFAGVDVWGRINKKMSLGCFPQQEHPIRFLSEFLKTTRAYWGWRNDNTFHEIVLAIRRFQTGTKMPFKEAVKCVILECEIPIFDAISHAWRVLSQFMKTSNFLQIYGV